MNLTTGNETNNGTSISTRLSAQQEIIIIAIIFSVIAILLMIAGIWGIFILYNANKTGEEGIAREDKAIAEARERVEERGRVEAREVERQLREARERVEAREVERQLRVAEAVGETHIKMIAWRAEAETERRAETVWRAEAEAEAKKRAEELNSYASNNYASNSYASNNYASNNYASNNYASTHYTPNYNYGNYANNTATAVAVASMMNSTINF